jgi:hypothetical protein
MLASLRTTWRRTQRRWHRWHAKVRRERITLALLALLTLGVGEPLLCIIHCDLWLPSAFQHYLAGHQHHHNQHRPASPRRLLPLPPRPPATA